MIYLTVSSAAEGFDNVFRRLAEAAHIGLNARNAV